MSTEENERQPLLKVLVTYDPNDNRMTVEAVGRKAARGQHLGFCRSDNEMVPHVGRLVMEILKLTTGHANYAAYKQWVANYDPNRDDPK